MATIEALYFGAERHGVERFSWQGMATGDQGRGIQRPDSPDKTFQFVSGTASTNLFIEGSMDSTDGVNGTWKTLHDQSDNVADLAVANNATVSLADNTLWVRPNASAGAGTGIRVDALIVRRPFGQF